MMGQQYYVLQHQAGDQKRIELSELENILNYFRLNSHLHKGQIYICNLNGFYIDYDIRTGNVKLQADQSHQSITTFINPNIIGPFTATISIAIAYFSKFHLLKKLNELTDNAYPGIAELKSLIQNHQIEATAAGHLIPNQITKCINSICAYIVKNVNFNKNIDAQSINSIKSLDDAEAVAYKIKEALQSLTNSNVSHLHRNKL